MHTIILYAFPFIMDVVTSLSLFVGRHSLAQRGFTESTVGSVSLCFGIGYIIACTVMGRIVKPQRARGQMMGATILYAALCTTLALVDNVRAIQALFCILPIASGLFFNAYQSFLLTTSNNQAKPIMATAGHYTFAWSMGFAVGPFLSSALRTHATWSQSYFLAAALSLAVAAGSALFKPVAPRTASIEPRTATSEIRRSLAIAAWIGLAAGWTGWLMTATVWPVRATNLGYSPLVKGGVEFALACTQACVGLILIFPRQWTVRPGWLPLFGLFGVSGLILFGYAGSPTAFIFAAILYGVYTASMFNYMMYHALHDADKAVVRIATNETIIGVCLMLGPVAASWLHSSGLPLHTGFVIAALALAGIVTAQTLTAALLLRSRRQNGAIVK